MSDGINLANAIFGFANEVGKTVATINQPDPVKIAKATNDFKYAYDGFTADSKGYDQDAGAWYDNVNKQGVEAMQNIAKGYGFNEKEAKAFELNTQDYVTRYHSAAIGKIRQDADLQQLAKQWEPVNTSVDHAVGSYYQAIRGPITPEQKLALTDRFNSEIQGAHDYVDGMPWDDKTKALKHETIDGMIAPKAALVVARENPALALKRLNDPEDRMGIKNDASLAMVKAFTEGLVKDQEEKLKNAISSNDAMFHVKGTDLGNEATRLLDNYVAGPTEDDIKGLQNSPDYNVTVDENGKRIVTGTAGIFQKLDDEYQRAKDLFSKGLISEATFNEANQRNQTAQTRLNTIQDLKKKETLVRVQASNQIKFVQDADAALLKIKSLDENNYTGTMVDLAGTGDTPATPDTQRPTYAQPKSVSEIPATTGVPVNTQTGMETVPGKPVVPGKQGIYQEITKQQTDLNKKRDDNQITPEAWKEANDKLEKAKAEALAKYKSAEDARSLNAQSAILSNKAFNDAAAYAKTGHGTFNPFDYRMVNDYINDPSYPIADKEKFVDKLRSLVLAAPVGADGLKITQEQQIAEGKYKIDILRMKGETLEGGSAYVLANYSDPEVKVQLLAHNKQQKSVWENDSFAPVVKYVTDKVSDPAQRDKIIAIVAQEYGGLDARPGSVNMLKDANGNPNMAQIMPLADRTIEAQKRVATNTLLIFPTGSVKDSDLYTWNQAAKNGKYMIAKGDAGVLKPVALALYDKLKSYLAESKSKDQLVDNPAEIVMWGDRGNIRFKTKDGGYYSVDINKTGDEVNWASGVKTPAKFDFNWTKSGGAQ